MRWGDMRPSDNVEQGGSGGGGFPLGRMSPQRIAFSLRLLVERFYFACAMALAKSWYSSQRWVQMRSRAVRCSCAFALLPTRR